MLELLQYREKTYFNENDYYLMETYYGFRIVKIKFYNKRAYADGGLYEYMDTIRCVNTKELEGLDVTLKTNNNFIGRINPRMLSCDKNSLSGYMGIFWYKWDKKSSAYFWNDPNKLNIV